jgi:hypothetical protein
LIWILCGSDFAVFCLRRGFFFAPAGGCLFFYGFCSWVFFWIWSVSGWDLWPFLGFTAAY